MSEQEVNQKNSIEKIKLDETITEVSKTESAALSEAEKEIREKALESKHNIDGYRLPDQVRLTEQATGVVAQTNAQKAREQRIKDIEKVLARDLEDEFVKMTPERQIKFKEKGEETAAKINILLSKTKIKIAQVVKLIKKWLAMIPGVNNFFLEKEAKIKAEEIIRLKSIT